MSLPLPTPPIGSIKAPTGLAELDKHHHHIKAASISDENKVLNNFLNFSMENKTREDKKVEKLL